MSISRRLVIDAFGAGPAKLLWWLGGEHGTLPLHAKAIVNDGALVFEGEAIPNTNRDIRRHRDLHRPLLQRATTALRGCRPVLLRASKWPTLIVMPHNQTNSLSTKSGKLHLFDLPIHELTPAAFKKT